MAENRAGLGEWFRWDQNFDGSTTISDIWLMVGKVFHAPGDAALIGIMDVAPKFADFMELSFDRLGGFGSGFISIIVWLVVCLVVGVYAANLFSFLRHGDQNHPPS